MSRRRPFQLKSQDTCGDAVGYYDDAPPGLFGNMWVMGANVVFQTPEGSHRKAHSIAMGREHHELEGGF
jgi:hypothetical protein